MPDTLGMFPDRDLPYEGSVLYGVFPLWRSLGYLGYRSRASRLLRLVFACLDGPRIPAVQLYFRTRFDFQFAYTRFVYTRYEPASLLLEEEFFFTLVDARLSSLIGVIFDHINKHLFLHLLYVVLQIYFSR